MTALELPWPCPAPYYPPHKFCQLCHGTGVVSTEVLATLVMRPYPATFDDTGKEIFRAGREIVR